MVERLLTFQDMVERLQKFQKTPIYLWFFSRRF